MYDYRQMSPEERRLILAQRRRRGFPQHAPPHFKGVGGVYLLTAACYEHCHIFENPDDLSWLTDESLGTFHTTDLQYTAWVFLPNHYHIRLETPDIQIVSETLRLLHSRTATMINKRHKQRGRKVWYRFSDRLIRNENHYLATLNYIHYNPVQHGYVEITEWPWSSAHEYIAAFGEAWFDRIWRAYPVKDYGKGWDW